VRVAAERAAERPAVRAGDASLTCGELDDAADRVASVLADQGVRPGDRVGIHAEKSLPTVVSLYSVLRAGAAYGLIDPGRSSLRASYVATDCSVAAVITDSERLAALRNADARAAERGILVDGSAAPGFMPWDDVATGEPRRSHRLRSRVRALHVGIDRPAQGRCDFAPQFVDLRRVGALGARPCRRRRSLEPRAAALRVSSSASRRCSA
jgi:acyl-CoA synthetase (AMP-forming)/AMP-acid ligase II